MIVRVSPRAGVTVNAAFLIEILQKLRAVNDTRIGKSFLHRINHRPHSGGCIINLANL